MAESHSGCVDNIPIMTLGGTHRPHGGIAGTDWGISLISFAPPFLKTSFKIFPQNSLGSPTIDGLIPRKEHLNGLLEEWIDTKEARILVCILLYHNYRCL
jgi:hypothetical protein